MEPIRTTTSPSLMLGALADGGTLRALNLDDIRLLALGLRLLASAHAHRDGAVPANVRVLEGLLDRAVASAQVAARLPSPEALGSNGSAGWAMPATVDLMRVPEVANALGCGQRNVVDLVARGALAGEKRGGRWTFLKLDVLALLQARRSA